MAGRDVSATHVALMGITGSMAAATGTAAALCRQHRTTPRGVYEQHLWELQQIVFGMGEHTDALKPGLESARHR